MLHILTYLILSQKYELMSRTLRITAKKIVCMFDHGQYQKYEVRPMRT